MGLLASLRSISLDCKFIGCMITASHNPAEDNGCKLVDPFGDMLEEKWEEYATDLVNSNDLKSTLIHLCNEKLKSWIDEFDKKNSNDKPIRPNVTVAHDTRESCPLLLDAFKTGVEKLNGVLVNYGLLTTPQLHYMVRCLNTNGAYGEPNEDGYFNKLTQAFFNIWSLIDFRKHSSYDTELYVDGANGVGALKMNLMAKLLSSASIDGSYMNSNNASASNSHKNGNYNYRHRPTEKNLNIHLFNDASSPNDQLNHLVIFFYRYFLLKSLLYKFQL
jgi:phosphoacetylglucosamine mutase